MKIVQIFCCGQKLVSKPLVDHLADQVVKTIIKNRVWEREVECQAVEIEQKRSARRTIRGRKKAVRHR